MLNQKEICRSFYGAFLSNIAEQIDLVLQKGYKVKMIIDHTPKSENHCIFMVIFVEKEV